MKRNNLKTHKFTDPDKTFITERYVIENEEDLKKVIKTFKLNNDFLGIESNWRSALGEGRIILVTDEHPITNFPTYCFESQKDSTHPSSLIRITT